MKNIFASRMNYVECVNKGNELTHKAVQFDEQEDYPRALQSYLQAFNYYQLAADRAPSAGTRKMIQDKIRDFIDRAEQVKRMVEQQRENGKCAASKKVPEDKSGDGEFAAFEKMLTTTILNERPDLKLDQVAGLADAKDALMEAVIGPIQAPQLFMDGAQSWAGVLLYGPPGTGKTYIAKAVAGEGNCAFMSISASDLVNKYVGQSEQLVKALFKVARDNAPCVIFVDEADSVLGARSKGGGASDGASASMERLLNQFLVEMQGVTNGESNKRVVVIAGTNRPWALDGAVVRRLPKAIYISLPEHEARLQIIKMRSEGRLTDEMCETLAQATEGYSGSDLTNLINEIFMEQPRRVMNAKAFKVR